MCDEKEGERNKETENRETKDKRRTGSKEGRRNTRKRRESERKKKRNVKIWVHDGIPFFFTLLYYLLT